jgi:hypothetical protein
LERKQYYTPRNLCLSCRRVENGVPLALHAVFHANEPHVTATIKERYKSSYYTRHEVKMERKEVNRGPIQGQAGTEQNDSLTETRRHGVMPLSRKGTPMCENFSLTNPSVPLSL